ncbi:uncharacterized protein LOC126726322 isoform X3 [Quercus robur]|uniref:uncharacterized protein LOC126726322 isoform X2 n=1 Tax=Quercus robur TaxID=38942 RepID=UPI002161C7E1|nr:uncharacterized protein LOC126726322 isoform X2 [Quercus robur]XP_050287515.1 uncharacterized protein LOC126726322 isoform X3 [Quercus robur]
MARFMSYLMLLMFLVMTEEIHGGNSRSELVDVPTEEQLSALQKEVINLQKEVDQLDRSKIQEVKREIGEWKEKYFQSWDEAVKLQDELFKLVIKNSNLHQERRDLKKGGLEKLEKSIMSI